MRAALHSALICLLLLLLPGLCVQTARAAPGARFDLSRPDIQSFISETAAHAGLSRRSVTRLLRAARPQPQIIELVSRPAEQLLPWWQYRANFLTAARIAAGIRFWNAHRRNLERIAANHGVPPEYIVAILGCETFYGRITGAHRVLDALATLAFDYPLRADYFRDELAQFMLLAREARLNPLKVKGSYTGAMGAPQFMPSSYRRYALGGDSGRGADLWQDWDRVFLSIANFLSDNGWTTGQPVMADARLAADARVPPGDRPLQLSDTLESLSALGIRTDSSQPPATPVMLVAAERQDGAAWRVGFANFYVITRYNHSARYAMAVHDLAQALAAGIRMQPPD